MKQKWSGMRVVLSLCLAMGWWNFWYPQLGEAAGVYTVVCEEGAVQKSGEVVKCEAGEYSLCDLWEMDSDRIQFRSRLLEWLEEYFNKG